MTMLWVQLAFMLIVILVAAQIFTNALEHAGHRLGISAGVTGSIFAAVGTALPETFMPVLAILAGTSNQTVNEEIGVGAILGAPLMLSTLSIAIMAISVIRRRGLRGFIQPEQSGLKRDLNFFLLAFGIAAVAMYVPLQPVYWRGGLSVVLLGIYVAYVAGTLRASKKLVNEGHGVVPDDPMYITKIGLPDNFFTINLQLVIGLVLLVVGAKGFIYAIANVAEVLHLSVLVLSLLLIPIATELPEKINSVLWVRKNKDTLAVGNITGAMVFQGSILPALGILMTPWQPSRDVMGGIVIAFIAATWLRLMTTKKGIVLCVLLVNGGLYLAYLGLTFFLH
jgi:cation:H+ antiporter